MTERVRREAPPPAHDPPHTAAATIPPMGELLVVLIVILVIVLMWRGPKTLPRLGEALGRGVRAARQEASRATEGDPESPRTDDQRPT